MGSKERELENVERKQRQVARKQLVTAMLEGQSWQQVSLRSPVPLKRAMAYRLLRAVGTRGNIALQDGRHGHPSKVRGEIRTFLEVSCRDAPDTPSSAIQAQLQAKFNVRVSISQINRVRAQLGVSNHPKNRESEKKRQKRNHLYRSLKSGRKERAVSCCWLLPIRRICSPIWRPLSPQHR